jgi:hypothetical protein
VVSQDFNFHSNKLFNGIINKKGTCIKSIYVHVQLFFKDEAGDYKPIGCVAATLNNSVLQKTRIPCDATVKYFVCKQSEYTLWLCSL